MTVWVAESTGHFKYGAIAVGRTEAEAREAAVGRLRDLMPDWEAAWDETLDDYVRAHEIGVGRAVTI